MEQDNDPAFAADAVQTEGSDIVMPVILGSDPVTRGMVTAYVDAMATAETLMDPYGKAWDGGAKAWDGGAKAWDGVLW